MNALEFLDAVAAAEERLGDSVDLAAWDRELQELERVAPAAPEASVLEALYMRRAQPVTRST